MGRLLVLTMILVAMALPTVAPAAAQADADTQNRLIELAQRRPSVVGPLRGDLPTGPGAVRLQSARVDVRDFYATATFTTPDSEEEATWDVGISFRRTNDDELALIIDSSGTWSFQQGVQPVIASGPVPSLVTAPGEFNIVDLVAVGGRGYFAVNGEFVSRLDLSGGNVPGDVAVGAAYFANDQRNEEFAAYDGFEIWSLDRTPQSAGSEPGADVMSTQVAEATATAGDAGPLSGELLLEEDELDFSLANVRLRDFYAHVVFTNPYAAEEHPWDIGIGFRDPDPRAMRALRLVIDSDGNWFLSQGPDPFRVSGGGAQVETGAGGRNEIDLVAIADTGYLSVNGDYVATLDLSASDARGDVWVSSGFFAENTLVGATTEFSDFRVWFIDAPEPTSEPVEVVVWGDGEVLFDLHEVGESGLTGLISLVANGAQTTVEVGVVGPTEEDQVGIYAGMCDALEPAPAFELEPVLPETMSSVTTLDVGFDVLTNGGYAIAIHDSAEQGAAVLACNEIPNQAEAG
jgi:hypothetical protein